MPASRPSANTATLLLLRLGLATTATLCTVPLTLYLFGGKPGGEIAAATVTGLGCLWLGACLVALFRELNPTAAPGDQVRE